MIDHINVIVNELEKHPTKQYGRRRLSDIDKIILHHSGTKNGKAQSYARYHVNSLGWPGIGYHMVADASGLNITNDFTAISYHTAGKNTQSLGLCQTGNFDLRPPTDQEYWNWIQMILYVDNLLGKELEVHYHREYSSKRCPGAMFDASYFEKQLKGMREIYND